MITKEIAEDFDKKLMEHLFGYYSATTETATDGAFSIDTLRRAMDLLRNADAKGKIIERPRCLGRPQMTWNGLSVRIVDAQDQRRTPRDVPGPKIRPRCFSKLNGRRGTRRAWKRANPPRRIYFYREPEDVIILHNQIAIMTPLQWRETKLLSETSKSTLI